MRNGKKNGLKEISCWIKINADRNPLATVQGDFCLSKKLYLRVARNRQMLGNRITARLCACRYAVAGGNIVIAKGRHGRRHTKR